MTKITQAVILAAGMGTRLKKIGKLAPKGFLRLGDKTIIEESLDRLIEVGVEKIYIVTGHLKDQYEKLVIEKYSNIVQLIHNPEYATTGSMVSLHKMKGHIKQSPYYLLESDIIYERLALTSLADTIETGAVLLSGQTNAGDEVYVSGNKNCLDDMSKNADELNNVVGELVGITLVTPSIHEFMIEWAEQNIFNNHQICYETDCLVAAAKEMKIPLLLIKNLVWAEIDDHIHLTRAKRDVYPNIIKSNS